MESFYNIYEREFFFPVLIHEPVSFLFFENPTHGLGMPVTHAGWDSWGVMAVCAEHTSSMNICDDCYHTYHNDKYSVPFRWSPFLIVYSFI